MDILNDIDEVKWDSHLVPVQSNHKVSTERVQPHDQWTGHKHVGYQFEEQEVSTHGLPC